MTNDSEGQGRLRFAFDEERDILEVVYPTCVDVPAVREAMAYMQTGPVSSHGRALINLTKVEETTLTSADLVSFANQRARDFGDKSRTHQFNAFYGVKDTVRDTIDAWTRFFPTGGGAVEMRLFEARHDAIYWLMGCSARGKG